MKVNKKKILSPVAWIKKVHGSDYIEYLMEEGISIDSALQLMEWYGDYVKNKLN